MKRGIEALLRFQEKDGSWFGRWGMNYIYGSWSALCALHAAGQDPRSEPVRRAVDWLVGIQNPDGGWGESADSYGLDYKGFERAASTASQTAWALLGLMAAGETDHPAVARGVAYLTAKQGSDGFWEEPFHTATGFPRVFYLRYHGYSKTIPALGARALSEPEARQQPPSQARYVAALRKCWKKSWNKTWRCFVPRNRRGTLASAVRSPNSTESGTANASRHHQ